MGGTPGHRMGVRFSGTMVDTAELASQQPAILRFYEKHPRASLNLSEQLKQIQNARALTQDEAVLESSALMVQALVSQLRPLLASIAEFDRKIAMIFRKHPDRPIFESFP